MEDYKVRDLLYAPLTHWVGRGTGNFVVVKMHSHDTFPTNRVLFFSNPREDLALAGGGRRGRVSFLCGGTQWSVLRWSGPEGVCF
jgi:hypothetical protein